MHSSGGEALTALLPSRREFRLRARKKQARSGRLGACWKRAVSDEEVERLAIFWGDSQRKARFAHMVLLGAPKALGRLWRRRR